MSHWRRNRNAGSPRRKVVKAEKVYTQDYYWLFTLECGHQQARTKHQECATLSCWACKDEAESK